MCGPPSVRPLPSSWGLSVGCGSPIPARLRHVPSSSAFPMALMLRPDIPGGCHDHGNVSWRRRELSAASPAGDNSWRVARCTPKSSAAPILRLSRPCPWHQHRSVFPAPRAVALSGDFFLGATAPSVANPAEDGCKQILVFPFPRAVPRDRNRLQLDLGSRRGTSGPTGDEGSWSGTQLC